MDRPIHRPQRLHDILFKLKEIVIEPTSYSEPSQTLKWVDTMKQEMNSIHKNHTWMLVDLLHDMYHDSGQ
jgi:hypothetical protein